MCLSVLLYPKRGERMDAKQYKKVLHNQLEILIDMWKEENKLIPLLSGNTQTRLKIIELKCDIAEKLYRLEHER